MTIRFDQFTLRPARRTPEGYLLCAGRTAKAGVLVYHDGLGGSRRELVEPEELQRHDSLASVALKPVTDGHPEAGMVTADNARELARGVSLQRARYHDGYVEIEIIVTDGDLADEIERGDKAELSLGYHLDELDETPGVHPVFGPYDARQVGRKANHVAVVERGRAGPTVRIRTDSVEQNKSDIWYYREDHEDNMSKNKNEKQAKVNGLGERLDDAISELRDVAVKIAESRADEEHDEEHQDQDPDLLDEIASAMGTFIAHLEDLQVQADELQAQHDQRAAQLDAMLEEMRHQDKENYHDLEGKDMAEHEEEHHDRQDADPEKARLDWYNERRELEAAAKRYDALDAASIANLANADLKREIVKAHFGEARCDGVNSAQIDGLFLAAQEIAKQRRDSYERASDAVRKSRTDGAGETAQERYNRRMYNGGVDPDASRNDTAAKLLEAIKSLG